MASNSFLTGLPPAAYFDPALAEREKHQLLAKSWQWAGLTDGLGTAEGLRAEIAELPIAVKKQGDRLAVYLDAGAQQHLLPEAEADLCGRFVFVRLQKGGSGLSEFLGDYAALLRHCSEDFNEAYHAETVIWNCNWKAGLEVTLEGYHVPHVHAADKSNLADIIPEGMPPQFNGPHSYQCGLMSEEMKEEMANIARRLKIAPSALYSNYDHFTLFPNMTVGLSGGNLCFLQIYSPSGPERVKLSYVYIMAKPLSPAAAPPALVKKTLLDKWRAYTHEVLGEDRFACEMFQRGVRWSERPALIGSRAENRVAHFHKYWRQAMENADTREAA